MEPRENAPKQNFRELKANSRKIQLEQYYFMIKLLVEKEDYKVKFVIARTAKSATNITWMSLCDIEGKNLLDDDRKILELRSGILYGSFYQRMAHLNNVLKQLLEKLGYEVKVKITGRKIGDEEKHSFCLVSIKNSNETYLQKEIRERGHEMYDELIKMKGKVRYITLDKNEGKKTILDN